MNFEKCLRELDKIEDKRKADYSIWGYLYQFDLAFYDMICQYQGKDLFEKCNQIKKPIYELETIEDYSKYYEENNINYLNLAQVKYSSGANEFTHWNVLLGLYYNYLYIKNNCNDNITINCSIFFSTPRPIQVSKQDIINTGKKIIKDHLNKLSKVAIDISDGRINKLSNFENRIDYVYKKYHTEEQLTEFINNSIIIKWFEDKNKIREKIKKILLEEFGDKFTNIEKERKGDILYSLGINYIINEWQNKNKRKHVIKIDIENILNYYSTITLQEDEMYENLYLNYIRSIIDEIMQHAKRRLVIGGKNYEEAEIEVRDKLSGNADKVYEYLSVIFNDKHSRYSLLNTVMLTPIVTKEEYFKLDKLDEFLLLSQAYIYLKSFIQRLFNIMYFNDTHGLSQDNDLDRLIVLENDFMLIKLSSERRKSLLLPKGYPDPLDNHEVIFDRIIRTHIRPTVWYFDDDVPRQGRYDLLINKVNDKTMNIGKPYDNNYYIECMKCLKENEFFNICDINCIFNERCKENGNSKY